jgi:hypothetical protein
MKYLCMVYVNEKNLNALSKSESAELEAKSMACDDVLRKSGRLIAAQALQSVESATILRIQNGKVALTDGPFAETNEQLGGFILIEARDLNGAIQLASKIPAAFFGMHRSPVKELRVAAQMERLCGPSNSTRMTLCHRPRTIWNCWGCQCRIQADYLTECRTRLAEVAGLPTIRFSDSSKAT